MVMGRITLLRVLIPTSLLVLAAISIAAEGPARPLNNHPTWTPDGERIVFVSNRTGAENIYVMSVYGSDPIQLTDGPIRKTYPSVSPNGEHITFITIEDRRFLISVMNSDGSSSKVIVNDGTSYEPRFSPDGDLLVYTSQREENADIYLLNLETMEERCLVGWPETEGFPSFFPDGKTVLFQSRVDGFNQIFRVRLDGSHITQITSGPFNSDYGHVSPDGTRIVFSSDESDPGNVDGREIYVMNIDGTQRIRLTRNSARDGYPKWSPDGKEIVFHATRVGHFEVYVMNSNGTGQMQLTGPKE